MTDQFKVKRQGNIELLRILSMILIICWHFGCHGISIVDFDFTAIGCFHWVVRSIANNAVNIYVLISAYFLCTIKFKTKKLVSLAVEVWFYSVLIYFMLLLSGGLSFSVKDAFTSFFPIISGQYWFVSSYVLLYILSPFLNKTIETLDKKLHLTLVGILLVSFSVIPTFLFFVPWINWGSSCGIVWMIVLYFVGSYLRKYMDIARLKKNRLMYITIILCLMPFFSKVFIAYISRVLTGGVVGSSIFYMNNSVLIVASSISIFLFFLTINISNENVNRVIQFISPSTFAVYLIHDNPFLQQKMWRYFVGHMHLTDYRCIYEFFGVILIIFLSCVFIDLFRRLLFFSLNNTSVIFNVTGRLKNIKLD